jgi:DNA (cytosine-5)-methyltransferase 1
MEAPIQAMRNIRVNFEHKFSCDIDEHARATIQANFPEGILYHDLTKRDNTEAPDVDLYVAGFPCQPFSVGGKKQGFKDWLGRGEIFFHVLDFLATKKPRAFILENVKGLISIEGGKYLKAILNELESLDVYNIKWEILNTRQQGIPHSRGRWYCVGIRKEFDDGSFIFPEAIPMPSVELFLERRKPKLAATGLPPKTQTVPLGNVKAALRTLKREGSDPVKDPIIIDCDSTPSRSAWSVGFCPCLTARRGNGHWVTNRGRRLTHEEMMRLQGMNPNNFMIAVPESQLGKQLGNTMSVNVIERVLVRLLPAAKLVRHGQLKDHWKSGQAVRRLTRTRGRGFKALSAKAREMITTRWGAKCRAAADARDLSPVRRVPAAGCTSLEMSPTKSLKRRASNPTEPGALVKRMRH